MSAVDGYVMPQGAGIMQIYGVSAFGVMVFITTAVGSLMKRSRGANEAEIMAHLFVRG